MHSTIRPLFRHTVVLLLVLWLPLANAKPGPHPPFEITGMVTHNPDGDTIQRCYGWYAHMFSHELSNEQQAAYAAAEEQAGEKDWALEPPRPNATLGMQKAPKSETEMQMKPAPLA